MLVIGSAVAGLVTISLVWTRRFELARYSAAAAVGAILIGFAVGQRPDLLPGAVTVDQAAAGDSTLFATLVALAIALAVIIPSLAYLYRLKLSGGVGDEFHPIGVREDEDR